MTTPPTNTPEYTVSELGNALKRTVENAYGYVRVRGEISGFKRAASGHLYLCLKDAGAVIDGIMWKGGAGALPLRPEDGTEVIAAWQLDYKTVRPHSGLGGLPPAANVSRPNRGKRGPSLTYPQPENGEQVSRERGPTLILTLLETDA